MKFQKKHGLWGEKGYTVWCNIRCRCYNKYNSAYNDWGGRGIKMYEPWIDNPVLFVDYVKSLPNYNEKSYTLDRIDNDGNYEPNNLRWVSYHVQNVNRRSKRNKSGYIGISIIKGKYYKSKCGSKYLGSYNTLYDAVNVRNNYIIDNNLTEYKIQEI